MTPKNQNEDHDTEEEDVSFQRDALGTDSHGRQKHREERSGETLRRGGKCDPSEVADPLATSLQPCHAFLANMLLHIWHSR